MNIFGKVYKITNKINGKTYIGQTIRSIQERFNQHCKADSVIGAAIRKYGRGAFQIEAIAYCSDGTSLDQAETQLIQAYSSLVPAGYNVDPGPAYSEHVRRNQPFYNIDWQFSDNGDRLLFGTKFNIHNLLKDTLTTVNERELPSLQHFLATCAGRLGIKTPLKLTKVVNDS